MTTPDTRPRVLRRTGDSEVAPIELFFDLVYVFAIVQVSHTLLYHLTPLGALETAVLFAAVWWLWNYSAWAMNYLDPARPSVRMLNAGLMLAALGMALALPGAFGDSGLLFALCFAAAQIGRPLFLVVTMSESASILRASGSTASPAGVSVTADPRLISGEPSSSSSARSARLRVGWATPTWSAARVKLRTFATATKYMSC